MRRLNGLIIAALLSAAAGGTNGYLFQGGNRGVESRGPARTGKRSAKQRNKSWAK